MTTRDDLLATIAREQALIARLEREREEAQARIRSLQSELKAPVVPSAVPTAAAAKVTLFRGLSRGRDEMFPKLWINPRTNRKGYAPACANERVRGVCDKPRVKCSECPNQAFIPVSDDVVVDHLRGRHVIGVYPLLRDETCWFLAADFHRESRADDVAAFVETCRRAGFRRRPSARGPGTARTFGSSSPSQSPLQPTVEWDAISSPRRYPGGTSSRWEEHLRLPFETDILGIPVTVEGVDLTEADEIVAICRRGRARQTIVALDLPLPSPPPDGAEWIEAYRYWVRRR